MSLNKFFNRSENSSHKHWLIGSSVGAIMLSMSFAATAQDTGPDDLDDDEIVATGIRQSLENAQAIKRNADTFVDSITASDIGALPDRSVLEAIQRVPGVSISRFGAGDDPDHFSVEGSGVVIRGLDFVRSEFNGRDTFSANNGRALGFQDVPPELVGGVDVFKNQTADMIEGGISGVVNLRTLKPFDRSERTIAATVDATASRQRTPMLKRKTEALTAPPRQTPQMCLITSSHPREFPYKIKRLIETELVCRLLVSGHQMMVATRQQQNLFALSLTWLGLSALFN